jgi:cytochrome P450
MSQVRDAQTSPPPEHPIAAVTHASPYRYYAELVARRPLYRDDALGLWVASSAAAATSVLTSDVCHVRPAGEPVPRALAGSPAGEIFGRLVRMNDGPRHAPLKQAVSGALEKLGENAREESLRWAPALAGALDLVTFPFDLPVFVIGSLLGVSPGALRDVARSTGELVRAFAPGSATDQVERGAVAARRLLDLFRSLAEEESPDEGRSLLAGLRRAADPGGIPERDTVLANGIGLLTQAYEATAGLIGNTLLALGSDHTLRARVTADPALLAQVVEEVLRFDAPVQNTRRFLARSGRVAGEAMREGDVVLVILAAANRDPAANGDPDRFDPRRRDRRTFTFGAGVHACPGQVLATTIATAGVAAVVQTGLDLELLCRRVTYRPSANTRVPLLHTP